MLDGDEWVIDGHKWFTSGAVGAELAIAMVVTDPDAPPYARASMICVPTDTPGFELVRPIPVMGHDKGPGHCEIRYERLPRARRRTCSASAAPASRSPRTASAPAASTTACGRSGPPSGRTR